MNWDAIGAIAELLGAIAVFATLVYLTVQVRQSAKALEQQNQFSAAQIMQARTDTVMQYVNTLLDSEENLSSYSSITETPGSDTTSKTKLDLSKTRDQLILSMARSLYENVYQQYKQGFLTEDFYQGIERNILGCAKSWLETNTPMSSEFKKEVLRIYKSETG